MAFIRLPSGIRVVMEYELFGKLVVNVYHVTSDVPITTVVLGAVGATFENWWTIDLAPLFSLDVALVGVTALNLDVENGEKVEIVVAPPVPGEQLDEGVPANVALVASFATALTGRSFRGRSYHAGLNEGAVTGNDVGTARVANLIAAYGDLVIDLDAISMNFVVASFQTAGAPRAVGVATEIDSVSANTRVDTQRRRLPT